MARNSLNGLYFWPRDYPEDRDIYSAYTNKGHYCLWNDPKPYSIFSATMSVDDEEELISPKCIVRW